MQRRNFLQMMAAAGVVAVAPLPGMIRPALAQPGQYNGPLLISFNLRGGWDQGSLADPRQDPNINRWARNSQPAGQAGNLRYSPLAGQAQAFYDKYFQSLMVINGVDLQTNGHRGGRNHRNTGSLSSNYPSTGELLAAANGGGMPMPFVEVGGFDSRGIVPSTGSPDEGLLRTLATPNVQPGGDTFIKPADLDTLKQFRLDRLQRLKDRTDNLPRWQAKYDELNEARAGSVLLDNLAQALPGGQLDTRRPDGTSDRLVSPLHLALVTMATGMTVSANVGFGGWDSHGSNDSRQSGLIDRLLGLIDYVMGKAAQVGLANRVYVHVTSDVGRTPRYNGNNGKDHWPVSSDLLLKANAPWANRHVGVSSDNTGRQPINFQTLAPDNSGRLLHPEHVLNELRIELGIDQNPVVRRYPLTNQRFPMFDPGVSSNIPV
jgi:hypothetical protein